MGKYSRNISNIKISSNYEFKYNKQAFILGDVKTVKVAFEDMSP